MSSTSEPINLRKLHDQYSVRALRTAEFGLAYLETGLELYDVKDDPEYQRAHRWTEKQQSAFVGHVLTGGVMAPIIANATTPELEDGPCHIVDGKQRLRALLRWLRDEIPAVVGDLQFFRRDCDPRTVRLLDVRIKIWIVRLDEVEVLRLYLRLNRGGTPHTEDEIQKVEVMLAQKLRERGE